MTVAELQIRLPSRRLVPGDSCTGEVSVRNVGPEVEQMRLRPAGPLAEWTTLSVGEAKIWPGRHTEVEVTVELPRRCWPPAGESFVAVEALTSEGQVSAYEGVEVSPFVDLAVAQPLPHALETARSASVVLTPTNQGNVPVWVDVTVADRQGRLAVAQPTAAGALRLDPCQTAWMPTALRFRRIRWVGRSAPCDYTVTAGAEEVEAESTGVLVQAPVLRRWWVALWLALAAVTAVTWADDPWRSLGFTTVVTAALLICSGLLIVAAAYRLLRVPEARPAARPEREDSARAAVGSGWRRRFRARS